MDLIRKYEVVILQFQKKPELSLWNVHRLYISVDFFGDKLQVLLQIVGQGSHQNMFIGIFYSSGIHPFHVVVINQRTQNWLYTGASAFSEKTSVIGIAFQFFVHFVIERFVDRIIYLFKLGHSTTTFCAKRTIFAVALATAVDFF